MKNRLLEIITILSVVSLLLVLLYNKKEEPYKSPSLSDSIDELQVSYQKYKSMTGKQLHAVWNDLFFYSNYKMDGKIRKNEFDCAIGETEFLRTLGSNVAYENTEMKEKRLNRIVKPYKSLKEVQTGDIIIFKRIGDFGHIALVEKVKDKTIHYLDINKGDDGAGYHTIDFKNPRISGIYSMTFDYWSGNILSE